MIEMLKNGKWLESNVTSWSILTINRIPYMGKGTKWIYYIVSSTILKSCNIIRSDIDCFNCKTLKLKELEGNGEKSLNEQNPLGFARIKKEEKLK